MVSQNYITRFVHSAVSSVHFSSSHLFSFSIHRNKFEVGIMINSILGSLVSITGKLPDCTHARDNRFPMQ